MSPQASLEGQQEKARQFRDQILLTENGPVVNTSRPTNRFFRQAGTVTELCHIPIVSHGFNLTQHLAVA